jgi:hypothetical protein
MARGRDVPACAAGRPGRHRRAGPMPASGPQLRLITCGGAFDPVTRSYLANVVVYATGVG